jgi:hypothetical protein
VAQIKRSVKDAILANFSNYIPHVSEARAYPGGGTVGLQPNPSKYHNRNLKNTELVDIMISNVLRDSCFRKKSATEVG